MGNDDDVVVFVVWSSQLGAKEKHVAEAAELMPDRRARHFWDGDKRAGRAWQSFLGLDSPAWDVWLLFPPEVRWQGDAAPIPAWWEHQLRGLPRHKKLDAERFASKARELWPAAQ